MFESFRPKSEEDPKTPESIEGNSGVFAKIRNLYKENPFSFKTALTIASMTAAFSANADEASFNPVLEDIHKTTLTSNAESAESIPTVLEAQENLNKMIEEVGEDNAEKDYVAKVIISGLTGEEATEKNEIPELPQSGSGDLGMKSGFVNGEQVEGGDVKLFTGSVYNYTIDNLSETYSLTGGEVSETITVDAVTGMSAEENILNALESSVQKYVDTVVDSERAAGSEEVANYDVQEYKSSITSSIDVPNLAWEINNVMDDDGKVKEYVVTYHILQSE